MVLVYLQNLAIFDGKCWSKFPAWSLHGSNGHKLEIMASCNHDGAMPSRDIASAMAEDFHRSHGIHKSQGGAPPVMFVSL